MSSYRLLWGSEAGYAPIDSILEAHMVNGSLSCMASVCTWAVRRVLRVGASKAVYPRIKSSQDLEIKSALVRHAPGCDGEARICSPKLDILTSFHRC